MHGKIVLFYFVTILSFNLSGQSLNDTANTPYWIEMMQDKSINFYRTQRAFNIYWQNRPIVKGSGWKAFKRWEWISMKTIDSLGNFPDYDILQQLHDDRIRMDNMYWDAVQPGLGAGSVACKTQGDWKPIGPTTLPINNTGQMNGMGRVNAIALHPTDTNTYFVGSAAGGIWKTSNNGLTWSVNTDSLPTLGVSAIAITKSNPSIMYFGSGDRDNSDAAGYGVFKSTNGGSTWAISNSGMGNRTVGRLIIDPNNASILIAACNGGIYRSTNAGSSWTQVLSAGGAFFKDIIFKPDNSKVVYATAGGFFYRSLDNGVNWTNITSGLPTTSLSRAVIDVNPLDNSLVYFWIANGSVNKGVYLSRDSGTTFRTQSTTPNLHDYSTTGSGTGGQAWYDMDMVTDPTNAAIMYCGGVNIFKSSDTGKTWTIAGYWVNQIHADQHELISCPITKRIFAGNDGGLYYSRTKGTPWVQVKSGLGIAQIYRMDASRTQKDILINGWQDNGTGNYNNGWYTTYGGDGMDCEIDQTDNRYSYGELYYGSVFRVFNVSAQATIATNGYIAAGSDTINESGDWVTPITLREGSGITMYIGYKNLWRSNNIRSSTVTWKKISNNLGGTNSYNFTEIENCIGNTDILYASRSNGTFYRSDNVNATTPTWTAITQPVSGVIQAIETDPKNPGVVYIGIGPYVYRSKNKGATWTQVATTHTYNVGSILLDTSSKQKGLYVGTIGGGVWYTDTTLSAWRYFSKGLPNTVRVTDLEMYYEPTPKCNCNILYGSTYNRGTWYSTIYNDGTKKPVAMLEPYDSIICSSASVTFKDKSCFNPGRFKWEFSPYTISYINGTDTFSPNASVSFNAKGTYAFKFMAENCIGIDTFRGTIIVSDTLLAACKPSTNNFNVAGLGIFKVDMAGFTRSSQGRNPEGSYIDVSCSKVIKVTRGKTYALKVTTGSLNTEQVKAYIDYNNNGSLTDAGELVYQPSASLINHLDSITIPSTATVGKILRLRIRSDFTSIGTNPCNTLNYGQTEDYGLWVESGVLIPKFVVNKNTACQNTQVKVTDSTIGSGASYSWNFGSGASPGTASGKGPYNVTYSTAGYKTITLVVDGKTYKKDSAVLVYAAPNISISFTKGDSSICEKLAISMKANDANSSGSSYQWRYNGSNVTDSTLNVFRFSNATLARTGAYSVMAFTAQCRDTAFQNIYIRPVPVPKFTINDSDQCLSGNSFTFTNATTIASGTYKNYWYPGDGSLDSTTSKTRTYSTYNTFNVKLRSVSTFGCKDSITKQVKVYENAAPQYSTNKSTQCFRGNSFTHTNTTALNTGTYTSTWHFGDGTKDFTKNPPAKAYSTYAASYKVRLVVTTNNGCKDSIEKTMILNPNPVAGFNVNDTDQCLTGNSFVYTSTTSISSGTFKNFWYPGDGSVDSTTTSKTKTYSAYGSFQVKLRSVSNNGCKDSIIKLVQVYENAVPQFTINTSTQCFKGNSFTYTNTTTLSTGTYTNAWSFGDGTKDLNKNPAAKSYTVFNPTYKVKLVVSTNRGCKDSIEKTININPNPVASFNVNDTDQCVKGNNFVFTNAGNIASGTFTSSWNFDDGGTSLLNSPAHAYTAANTYKVKLKLTSNNLCTDSITKNIIVFHNPKAGFNVTDSTQCLRGNTFDFVNAGTIPSGSFTTKYFFGDGTSSNIPTLFKAYIKDSTFTVMMLTISNNGCRDSITRKMYVYPQTNPGFSINSKTQCFANNAYQFNNQSTLKSGTYTSLWRLGDGTQSISNTQVNKKYFTYVDSAKVTLIVTTNFNCVDSISKYIVLLSSPKADFTINDSGQCLKNNAFTFTNTSSINKGTISSAWSFGDGNTAGTTNSAHSYAVHNTAYTVKLVTTANAVCKDSISRVVIVFPMPKASFSINDSGQCFKTNVFVMNQNGSIPYGTYTNSWDMGDATQLSGNTPNHSYLSTGSYQVRLVSSSDQSCNDTVIKTVLVYHSPKADFSINDTVQCVNKNNFTFADQSVSGATYSRKWYAMPSLIPGTSGSVNHVFADTGFQTVKLFVSTVDLCTDSVMKQVYLAPTPVFSVTGNRKVCLNEDINLLAVSASSLSYEWSMDNGPAFSGNPFIHTAVLASTRSFTLKGTNSYGCENLISLPSRVTVYNLPVADIDTNVIVTVKGIDIEFMDVSAAAVSSRQWQFSNGGTGTNPTEIISLGDSGSVVAMLTVTDTNGCQGSVQRKYFFTIANSYYMPNIFTPNGDGHNDSFRMSGFVKLRKFSIKIFNRWGEMVFATEDPTQGWDGRSGGEFVIDGNYLYFLELEDLNGQLFQKKGMLTVLR